MDCKVAKQLMADYLMGMTDEEVKKEFEEHLNSCESCKEALEKLKKAEQEYDKKDEAVPLKKVNKVIRKHKIGKILSIIGMLILAAIIVVFVMGELKPENDTLPSITKIRYKHKAEDIVEELFDNNMDVFLNGTVSYLIAGTDNLPFTKAQCVKKMIVDYSEQLKNLNKDFLYDKKYSIKRCKISYQIINNTYMELVYPNEKEYKRYNYTASMELSTDLGDFEVYIRFFNDDNYEFEILFSDHERPEDEFQSKLRDINSIITHLERFASGADPFPYVINGRLLEENYEDGFIGIGKILATDNCHENKDDTYIKGFNERLEDIYYSSKTESFNLEVRGYNPNEHAINVELIWIIKDLNGYEAVMRKDLLYGPYGYQKLNDEAKIVAEEGFNKELEQKMKNLF